MPIVYVEKGDGLHAAVEAAGHTLYNRDGIWLSSDDVAVQAIIDGYTLDEAKAARKAECSAVARSKYEKVTAGISPAEMAGWPLLVAAAVQYRADGTIGQVISSEAAVRGIPVADLVAKIEGNSAKFQQARAAIAGTDGRKRDEIDALTTFEEVATYDVNAGWPI